MSADTNHLDAHDAHDAARVVLVVASRFAPQTGPGATRLTKMVKYLHEFGWQPVVLTADADADDTTGDIDADTVIARISPTRAADNLSPFAPLIRAAATLTRPFGRGACWWYRGLHWRTQRLREQLTFPDPGIWRIGPALRAARELHKRHRFAAIFSSGMPFSDHLIARAIQRELQLPWIAEFRDPWFEYAHAPQWRTALGRTITRRAEQSIIHHARFVVGVSPAMTQRLAQRYPHEPRGKFITILNGYDPADFYHAAALPSSVLPPTLDAAKFSVLHAGSFYATRRPEPLVRGFLSFLGNDAARREKAALVLVGRLGPHQAIVKELANGQPIHCPGTLPYHATLACMTRATINALVLPDGDGTQGDVSTKIFEYLAAGRPILAAVPRDAAAAQLLAPFEAVQRIDPDDDVGIAQALEHAYERWSTGRLRADHDPDRLAEFTRRRQTQHLAQALSLATRRVYVKPIQFPSRGREGAVRAMQPHSEPLPHGRGSEKQWTAHTHAQSRTNQKHIAAVTREESACV